MCAFMCLYVSEDDDAIVHSVQQKPRQNTYKYKYAYLFKPKKK